MKLFSATMQLLLCLACLFSVTLANDLSNCRTGNVQWGVPIAEGAGSCRDVAYDWENCGKVYENNSTCPANQFCSGGKCGAIPATTTFQALTPTASNSTLNVTAGAGGGAAAATPTLFLSTTVNPGTGVDVECVVNVELFAFGAANPLALRPGIYYTNNGQTYLTFQQPDQGTGTGFALLSTESVGQSLTSRIVLRVPNGAQWKCAAGLFPAIPYAFQLSKKREILANDAQFSISATANTAVCKPGFTACAGNCVDLATDSVHCGRCNAFTPRCEGVCFKGRCEGFGADESPLFANRNTLANAAKVTAFTYSKALDGTDRTDTNGGVAVNFKFQATGGPVYTSQTFTVTPTTTVPSNAYRHKFTATLVITSFVRDCATAGTNYRLRMHLSPAGPVADPIQVEQSLYNEFSTSNGNCQVGKSITLTWTQDVAADAQPIQPYVTISATNIDRPTTRIVQSGVITPAQAREFPTTPAPPATTFNFEGAARLFLSEEVEDIAAAVEDTRTTVNINLGRVLINNL